MSPLPFSPLLRAWYKWKMLRLPWRRKFLIGFDLNGNTYWEFLDRGAPRPPPPGQATSSSSPPSRTRPTPIALRWRRIVHYPRGTHHGDVAVPPAWHQWLRHTRADPPSIEEQRAEVARQARIKLLAAEADRRWEAKPKVMEDGLPAAAAARLRGAGAAVGRDAKAPGLGQGQGQGQEQGQETAAEASSSTTSSSAAEKPAEKDKDGKAMREETWKRMQAQEKETAGQPSPWHEQARRGPGEAWQPQAWEPQAKAKR
ncbi:hypothetical protein VTJ83DRAFT_2540 [Remersonia thermophila]|uniref:NADH dehydrogenase [ubiquinone] 1 alpha subcomplex subunit n=1 Tax=Remersonia thermophila TaxID=72144 RepID=A0ABR4DJB5_9PEZI